MAQVLAARAILIFAESRCGAGNTSSNRSSSAKSEIAQTN